MIPKPPFSTPLSSSAREMTERIRNLFYGQKKRPPVWLMALVVLAALLCGSLVSCQSAADEDNSSALGERATPDLLTEEILDSIPFPPDSQEVLALVDGENATLGAVCLSDSNLSYALILGVGDREAGELRGPVFQVMRSGTVPRVVTFQNYDGQQCLLYVANSAEQSYTSGEAGLVVFDGEDFIWTWPVEGDIRDQSSQAYADYTAYWETHKALLSPSGVDIFTENSAFGPYDGSPVQWEPETGLTFWSSDMDELPIGVYWQVRSWLEEFTRSDNNPWNAKNTSALWSIVSLTMVPAQQPDGISLLSLSAAADNDPSLYFGARLYFDPSAEDGQYIRPERYAMGSWDKAVLPQKEIQNTPNNTPQNPDAAEFSFEGTTFYYGGRSYDLTSRLQSINSILSVTPVGDNLVVECHVGPKNSVYSIFNTTSETFDTDIMGCHLVWYDDDITTAVYAFWSDIYAYNGVLIKSYDLAENQYIYGLDYSNDHTRLNVTIMCDDGTEQIDVIDLQI